MMDEKIKDKIFYYLNRMKNLKGNTNRLLNTYNLYNFLVSKYDEIKYDSFRKSCYDKIFLLIEDINSIKINYFYKKKIISKLLEFKLLYESNI